MIQMYTHEQFQDYDENPSGGVASGTGFVISWQKGPLGRGDERVEPNGAFVETILRVVLDRIQFYQRSPFACEENATAETHIGLALEALQSRTNRREAEGVEGTLEGS